MSNKKLIIDHVKKIHYLVINFIMDFCFKDTSVTTPSHKNTIKYIKNSILNDDDDIKTITIQEFRGRINDYRTKSNKKLSYGSVKCLFYTMQKERFNSWNVKEMKRAKNTFWTGDETINMLNNENNKKLNKAILYFVSEYFKNKLNFTDSQVAITILLTLATNFRMAELLQLKKKHLGQMMREEVITIHIKKKKKCIKVLSQNWIIESILLKIENENDDYDLIQLSRSVINKKIKEKSGITGVNVGIQSIRKLNTTNLLEHGNIGLAQQFNRHTRPEITHKYYNNKTYIGPTINKIMRANHKRS